MGKISTTLDKLIDILDQEEDLFIKRIDLVLKGDWGTVRFIDEKIFPSLYQKQNKQSLEITKAFKERQEEYGKCKKGTQSQSY